MKYAPRAALTEDALAVIARLRGEIKRIGWSETGHRCGMDRTALHRAFGPEPTTRKPNFATVAAVADAVGLEFSVRPKGSADDPGPHCQLRLAVERTVIDMRRRGLL